jgi:hypothetical protein
MLGLFAFAAVASCMIWLLARGPRQDDPAPNRRGRDSPFVADSGGGHAASCVDGGSSACDGGSCG